MVPALLHAADVGFSIFDRAEKCQVGGLLVKGGSAAGSWRWAGSSHASLFPKCISKQQPMAGGLVELGMLVGASAGGDRGGVLMNLTTQCSCMRVGAGDGSLQLEAEGRVCVDCVHWRLNTGSVNTELAVHAVGKRRRGSCIKTGVRSNTPIICRCMGGG
jgi:hypothetical protein